MIIPQRGKSGNILILIKELIFYTGSLEGKGREKAAEGKRSIQIAKKEGFGAKKYEIYIK